MRFVTSTPAQDLYVVSEIERQSKNVGVVHFSDVVTLFDFDVP